jgi:Antitoxin VbhA
LLPNARSVAQAAGSLGAEGLLPDEEATAITEQWARGEITTTQMRRLIRRLYGLQ